MKGNTIITFTIIFFLGLVFLSSIIFISYNYYKKYQDSLRDQAANQLSYKIISEITDMYFIGSKISNIPLNDSMIILEKKIKLPEKIAGETYYIEGISSTGLWNNIKINDTYDEKIFANKIGIIFANKNYYFDLPNMQINLAGKVKAGEIKISYVRYRYGNEIKNIIFFGENDVIIDIEKLE
ncbi:MAG: hypothetical protein QW350_02405 [Candidatus Aenigmatarchaeota archaeon]